MFGKEVYFPPVDGLGFQKHYKKGMVLENDIAGLKNNIQHGAGLMIVGPEHIFVNGSPVAPCTWIKFQQVQTYIKIKTYKWNLQQAGAKLEQWESE